jgi:hypothetical protein
LGFDVALSFSQTANIFQTMEIEELVYDLQATLATSTARRLSLEASIDTWYRDDAVCSTVTQVGKGNIIYFDWNFAHACYFKLTNR